MSSSLPLSGFLIARNCSQELALTLSHMGPEACVNADQLLDVSDACKSIESVESSRWPF